MSEMKTVVANQRLNNDFVIRNLPEKKVKFELVGCPVSGIYCSSILPEINALYDEAESAHINKEYQNAVELLKKAYLKTFELNESTCSACVNMFQSSIKNTMVNMQNEVKDMSFSFFCKKQYEPVYRRLVNCIKKINLFEIDKKQYLSIKESAGNTLINY